MESKQTSTYLAIILNLLSSSHVVLSWSSSNYNMHKYLVKYNSQSQNWKSLQSKKSQILRATEENENIEDNMKKDSDDNDKEPIIAESVVRVDDGGSDLTDRFKYKVNALMGTFDPIGGAVDDENQSGNILNAMLTFPTRFSFNVVGRTGGDPEIEKKYIDDVKAIVNGGTISYDETDKDTDDEVTNLSNEIDDENINQGVTYDIVPRGKNFVKVSVHATVESAAMINTIYESLASMELTTMSF